MISNYICNSSCNIKYLVEYQDGDKVVMNENDLIAIGDDKSVLEGKFRKGKIYYVPSAYWKKSKIKQICVEGSYIKLIENCFHQLQFSDGKFKVHEDFICSTPLQAEKKAGLFQHNICVSSLSRNLSSSNIISNFKVLKSSSSIIKKVEIGMSKKKLNCVK